MIHSHRYRVANPGTKRLRDGRTWTWRTHPILSVAEAGDGTASGRSLAAVVHHWSNLRGVVFRYRMFVDDRLSLHRL